MRTGKEARGRLNLSESFAKTLILFILLHRNPFTDSPYTAAKRQGRKGVG